MKPRDLAELGLLAAIWGGSFLFMRMGAGQFGPLALVWIRVSGAALVLWPLLTWRGGLHELRRHWRPLLVVGITNSALPFGLFAYALLTITGSLASVFNAATPLFGALIAWLWLKNGLTTSRVAGLVVGFVGVFGLAWNKASVDADAGSLDTALAVLACLIASLSYGFSASFAKKHAADVSPLALATGSQVGASLALALPAAWAWPAVNPGVAPWLTALALAFVCTGLAYVLYFRLVAHAGPANALAVTFLVPVFAVLWGGLFLNEMPTVAMGIGCAVIVAGTAFATGLLPWRHRPRPAVT